MSSRFGDYDGGDEWANLDYGRWLVNTKRVMAGEPAQRHFRQLEAALLAMPENKRRLISGAVCKSGQACAVGEMAVYRLTQLGVPRRRALRQVERQTTDYYGDPIYSGGDTADYAKTKLEMTFTLGWIIAETNDEDFYTATPEDRWRQMLEWTRKHIKPEAVPAA